MKFLSLFFACSQLVLIDAAQTNLPPPYDEVDLLPFNPHGWFSQGNAQGLKYLIETRHVKVVLEIGSWLGTSTRYIAQRLPTDGVIYAIDHWLGSPNENYTAFDMTNLYRQFLSNVIHANLTHKIIPLRMSSLETAKSLENIKPDLIYLDATHDFDNVYKDLTAWFPFVKGHGIFCGDDYFWGEGFPVKQAVDLFAQENDLIVINIDSFWYYEEKTPRRRANFFR